MLTFCKWVSGVNVSKEEEKKRERNMERQSGDQ